MRSPVIATKSVHPVYDVRQCGDFHWKWHSHARASVANRIKTAPTGVGQQLRGQGSTESGENGEEADNDRLLVDHRRLDERQFRVGSAASRWASNMGIGGGDDDDDGTKVDTGDMLEMTQSDNKVSIAAPVDILLLFFVSGF